MKKERRKEERQTDRQTGLIAKGKVLLTLARNITKFPAQGIHFMKKGENG